MHPSFRSIVASEVRQAHRKALVVSRIALQLLVDLVSEDFGEMLIRCFAGTEWMSKGGRWRKVVANLRQLA